MMKKYGAVGGLILGAVSIFGAFFIEGGNLSALFLLAPIMVVFGGTFAAVIIGFGAEDFINMFGLIKLAYSSKKYKLKDLIKNFEDFSIMSRKEGLLAVEKHLDVVEHYFPKKLIKYAIDGNDEDALRDLAYLEMKSMQDRHYSNVNIFTKMGGYAPTMGILGTVMALIMTLANADGSPDSLIKNIAAAFIATLWGVLSANLFWLPIGDKLKKCHLEEKHMMEMALEGTLALQNGEIPSIMKAKLVSMLPRKEQTEILKL